MSMGFASIDAGVLLITRYSQSFALSAGELAYAQMQVQATIQ